MRFKQIEDRGYGEELKKMVKEKDLLWGKGVKRVDGHRGGKGGKGVLRGGYYYGEGKNREGKIEGRLREKKSS